MEENMEKLIYLTTNPNKVNEANEFFEGDGDNVSRIICTFVLS